MNAVRTAATSGASATGLKLFVGNINWTTSNNEFYKFFAKCGKLRQAKIIYDNSGRSKGFGFVTFADRQSCQSALNQEQLQLSGKVLTVKPAASRA